MQYKVTKRFIYSEVVYVEADSKGEAEQIAIDQEEADEAWQDDLHECIVIEYKEQK